MEKDGIYCSKYIPALLKGITSKHHGKFYCLYCLYLVILLPSFFCNKKKKRECHKKVCENKDFCNIFMPFKDTKILEFHQYQKSHKASFIIYVDFICLIEKD